MNIILQNTGKRFNKEWIFRYVDYKFEHGKSYAITGANGSGKSTLLQIIAGATLHSEGNIIYQEATGKIQLANEEVYKNISLAAPYLSLIEEMTAMEFLKFHTAFKSLIVPFTQILSSVGLQNAANKQIQYFSSGMKQRLKLAQAFYSNTSVLLLDEPTTNLDEDGITIYKELLANNSNNRLIIISSNDSLEYQHCNHIIQIGNYK